MQEVTEAGRQQRYQPEAPPTGRHLPLLGLRETMYGAAAAGGLLALIYVGSLGHRVRAWHRDSHRRVPVHRDGPGHRQRRRVRPARTARARRPGRQRHRARGCRRRTRRLPPTDHHGPVFQTTGSFAIGLMLLSDVAFAGAIYATWRLLSADRAGAGDVRG